MTDNRTVQDRFREWYDQLQATGGLGDPIIVATDRTSQFSMLQQAWTAGWEARAKHTADKTEAFRLAYSADGERERQEEPFQVQEGSWVRGIMNKARPEQSPGTIEPDYIQHGTITGRIPREPVRYPSGPFDGLRPLGQQHGYLPSGPPPVTRIDDYTPVVELADQEFPLDRERLEAAAARYTPTTAWPAADERYAPTATMKASPDEPGHPDDTNPGFRVADFVLPEA